MKKILLATATAAMLAASFQIGAQQSAPAPQGPVATRAQTEALFTQEERNQFREKMRAAKTPEERSTVRKDMQSTVEQRAKEKGVTLPRGPQGGPGVNRDGNRPQLLTPEERQQNRDKMRAAKTPEERAALRQQMHELMEQRAKEKGITLPQGRYRGEPSQGPASTK